MIKITIMGAGSSVFVKNFLGDCLLTDCLKNNLEIALYDINGNRLKETIKLIEALNDKYNEGKAKIKGYHGAEERKEALRGADFVIIQSRSEDTILVLL